MITLSHQEAIIAKEALKLGRTSVSTRFGVSTLCYSCAVLYLVTRHSHTCGARAASFTIFGLLSHQEPQIPLISLISFTSLSCFPFISFSPFVSLSYPFPLLFPFI